MLKQLKKRTEGFTIIEVLIVLAIAGLILLIVFLAVPALQRNQRNTARKNDVGRIGGAITEFSSNNNGAVFTAGAGNANITTVIASLGNLSQYNLSAAAAAGTGRLSVAVGAQTNPNLVNDVVAVTGAVCAGSNSIAGTTRQAVLLYAVETSASTGATPAGTPVCQGV